MSFVQVQQSLINHRKTFRLAKLLNMDRFAVVGRIVALWSWCLDNAMNGCLGDIEPELLANVMGYDDDPLALADALTTAGFLDRDEIGLLWIHDWSEHMGRMIEHAEKTREQTRERMQRLRERNAPPPAHHSVTPHPSRSVTPTSPDAPVTRHSRVTDALDKKRRDDITVDQIPQERENAREDQVLPLPLSAPAPEEIDLPPPQRTSRTRLPAAPRPALTRPALARPHAPDPIWDACVAAMDGGPTNDGERGRWNKGVSLLKQSGATPPEVLLRAQRFRSRFGPDIPLHPVSLANNWRVLERDITKTPLPKEAHHADSTQRRHTLSARPLPTPDEWAAYAEQLNRPAAATAPTPTPRQGDASDDPPRDLHDLL